MDLILPTREGGWPVIYCDPPWNFKTYSKKGLGKSPEQHYPCMTDGDLSALPIAGLAADDCAMFMWATFPKLPSALALMSAWGFDYKTGGSWGKLSKSGQKLAFGTGYIFRSASELLLVGTRGKPSWKSKSERNLWLSPVREHSRKPDDTIQMIERLVDGPYLELFARTSGRNNWTAWGNDTDKFSQGSAGPAGAGPDGHAHPGGDEQG